MIKTVVPFGTFVANEILVAVEVGVAVIAGSAGIVTVPLTVPPDGLPVYDTPVSVTVYSPLPYNFDIFTKPPPALVLIEGPGVIGSPVVEIVIPVVVSVLIILPLTWTVKLAVCPVLVIFTNEVDMLYPIHRKKVYVTTFLRNISSIYTQYSYFAANTGALTRPSSSR